MTFAGLAARIAYVLTIGTELHLGFDSVWYELQAGTLAAGDGYIDPDAWYRLGRSVPTANFPPLWPALLALANRLSIESERGYQLVGAVVGTATVALTGITGMRLTGRRVGLGAAALVAISPALIAADGSLMADSLYVALVTAATLAAVAVLDRPNPLRFASMGLLLGAAALARSDALLLAPVLICATAWAAPEGAARHRLGLAAIGASGVALVVLPWSAYASARLDAATVLSSNSGSLLEGANCESAYSGELIGAWDGGCLVETRRPGRSEAEWSAAARSAGLRYAAQHPSRLAVVAPVRVMRAWGLWDPTAQADLEAVEGRDRDWQLGSWAVGLCVAALAIPGALVLARRVGRRAAPLAAVVVGSTIVVGASWGNPRFLLAAIPSIAIAAAAALVAGGDHLLATQPRGDLGPSTTS